MGFLLDVFQNLGLTSFVFIYFILNLILLFSLNFLISSSFEEEIFYLKEEPVKLYEENTSLKTNLHHLKISQEKEIKEFERSLREKEDKIRNIFEKSYRKDLKKIELHYYSSFEDKKNQIPNLTDVETSELEKNILEKIT